MDVVFVARIGEDMFGEMALRLYREEGIDIDLIHRTAEHPTGVGFILVEAATGNNCIALDPGANELLSAADVAQCDSSLDAAAVVMTQLEIPVATAEAALASRTSERCNHHSESRASPAFAGLRFAVSRCADSKPDGGESADRPKSGRQK